MTLYNNYNCSNYVAHSTISFHQSRSRRMLQKTPSHVPLKLSIYFRLQLYFNVSL